MKLFRIININDCILDLGFDLLQFLSKNINFQKQQFKFTLFSASYSRVY